MVYVQVIIWAHQAEVRMQNLNKSSNRTYFSLHIYIFFAKGIRGRISYMFNRYSKVNNNYLKSYDPKQEWKHIIYWEVNNLYVYGMSKFLPTSGFKWRDTKEFYLNKYTSNSSKGCIPEVDLEYPKELRELHNAYPLGPDKIEIKKKKNVVWLPIKNCW